MAVTVYQLLEPVIIALRARLQPAALQPYIDAINAAIPPGDPSAAFTITAPAQVFDTPPSLEQQSDFPIVWLQTLPSRFEDDLGSSVTGRHELLAVACCSNPDPEALGWQLVRYQQALTSALLAGRNLAGSAGWITGLLQTAPGPVLENPDEQGNQSWVSWTGVRLLVKREEA